MELLRPAPGDLPETNARLAKRISKPRMGGPPLRPAHPIPALYLMGGLIGVVRGGLSPRSSGASCAACWLCRFHETLRIVHQFLIYVRIVLQIALKLRMRLHEFPVLAERRIA